MLHATGYMTWRDVSVRMQFNVHQRFSCSLFSYVCVWGGVGVFSWELELGDLGAFWDFCSFCSLA